MRSMRSLASTISLGERGPGSIPGETHVEEIIRFLKMGDPFGSNPRWTMRPGALPTASNVFLAES